MPAAAEPHRRTDGPAAQRRLRHHRRARPGRHAPKRHARQPRPHPAGAPARRARAAAERSRPARRRPRRPHAAAARRDAGWPVAPSYGLTQTCSAATIGEIGDTETSGRAIPGVTIAIGEHDGEIVVGTVHTGDLGRLDDRGRLIVIGRKTDTIVTGGENVAPAEVEAVLRAHPAVADVGVFARPHPEWGETVIARVVLRDARAAPTSSSSSPPSGWHVSRSRRRSSSPTSCRGPNPASCCGGSWHDAK